MTTEDKRFAGKQAGDRSALRARLTLWTQRASEFVRFDCGLCAELTGWAAYLAGIGSAIAGRQKRALELICSAHRLRPEGAVGRLALRTVAQPANRAVSQRRLDRAFTTYLESIEAGEGHLDPARLVGSRLIVLKSPRENERGVLVIDYTYVFPLFAKFADLEALARRYYIVLEPSWVGYCTPEILLYARLNQPVFVQTNEPTDAEVLKRASRNLVQVPMQANWWVDHRVMRPHPNVPKDADVSMVAGWGRFKRHVQFFDALRRLRRRGRRLKVILVGYSVDGSLTSDDVYRLAKSFGIEDQVELFEDLQPSQVAAQLSRTKVHVLWSRREGSNRAIIEAMLTNVPGILREGFNYGYRYPYMNPLAGRYATEERLPETMTSMIDEYDSFAPREWIMSHMTPQIATSILEEKIKAVARARGENWTHGLAVKTAQLNRMTYWDLDSGVFAADYEEIRSLLRPPRS